MVGAGLSLVGTVDPSGLTWVSAARWPRLRALDLRPLADRTGLPVLARRMLDTALALLLETDATTADRTVALLHWGFGVGAAVAHRGTLLGSSLGRFGEIGHLRTPGSAGRRCACGARGCLETEAALWALLPRLRRRLGALPDDEQELTDALAAPGVAALPEVRTAVRAVQDGLVTLHRLFYPDEVFLAGPLAENPAVFRRLADGFAAGLPDYAVGKTSLTDPAGRTLVLPDTQRRPAAQGSPEDRPEEDDMNQPLQLTIVGGGMITADQLLPSIYHLQRTGVIGEITISALNNAPLAALRDDPGLAAAFPGQRFTPHPSFAEPRDRQFPGLYREVLAAMPKRKAVVVAVPDHLHYETVKSALECDQHVLCVKPLVLRHADAVELEGIARERGLFVGVEYHKRFDRRSLVARRAYREGRFGVVRHGRGEAHRAVLLPELEFPELVHRGPDRPVHLHRVSLRGPRVLHHGPEARGGFRAGRARTFPERERRIPLVARHGAVGERGTALRRERPRLP